MYDEIESATAGIRNVNKADKIQEKIQSKYFSMVESGIVYLADEGCGMYSALVVNGEEYGHVWYIDLANEVGAFPLKHLVTGEPLQFFDWLELWLDASLAHTKDGAAELAGYADFVPADLFPGESDAEIGRHSQATGGARAPGNFDPFFEFYDAKIDSVPITALPPDRFAGALDTVRERLHRFVQELSKEEQLTFSSEALLALGMLAPIPKEDVLSDKGKFEDFLYDTLLLHYEKEMYFSTASEVSSHRHLCEKIREVARRRDFSGIYGIYYTDALLNFSAKADLEGCQGAEREAKMVLAKNPKHAVVWDSYVKILFNLQRCMEDSAGAHGVHAQIREIYEKSKRKEIPLAEEKTTGIYLRSIANLAACASSKAEADGIANRLRSFKKTLKHEAAPLQMEACYSLALALCIMCRMEWADLKTRTANCVEISKLWKDARKLQAKPKRTGTDSAAIIPKTDITADDIAEDFAEAVFFRSLLAPTDQYYLIIGIAKDILKAHPGNTMVAEQYTRILRNHSMRPETKDAEIKSNMNALQAVREIHPDDLDFARRYGEMARVLHSETNKAKYGESVAILLALARQYPGDEIIGEDLAAAERIWARLP
ncbi:MAG: hypothetical protein LBT26_02415 [Clostridiales Family XIII bacterium]|jgi:hypothetical protein|nr:hypothetical protein [Clostridiales Family XIII bacterium]